MKVYVITQGEYSDYNIIGTTLNESVAQTICDNYNKLAGQTYRENYVYNIEVFDLMESIEDFNLGNEIWFEIIYESETKEIRIRNNNNGYQEDYLSVARVNDNNYIYFIYLKANSKNLLSYEKIMKEKIAQIDYEIENTFNGDVKRYVEYRNNVEKYIEYRNNVKKEKKEV